MSNLVPTQRVDRNGHVVIRHMKPEAASSTGKPLPSPVLSSVAHDESLRAAVSALEIEVDSYDEETVDLEATLSHCSDDELRTVDEWGANENASRLWILYQYIRGGEASSVRDYLHLADYMEECGIEEMLGENYIVGIQRYEGLTPLEDEYPQARYQQCKAIIDVSLSMLASPWYPEEELINKEEPGWTPYIQDENLRELLLAPDTDLDAAVSLIKERDIYDAPHIRELLSQKDGADALAPGRL